MVDELREGAPWTLVGGALPPIRPYQMAPVAARRPPFRGAAWGKRELEHGRGAAPRGLMHSESPGSNGE
jgi:hypothetical protein